MKSYIPSKELQDAMNAAFEALPPRMETIALGSFIHGLLEGYSVKGGQRVHLLMELVQATQGVRSVATGDGIMMMGGGEDEEPSENRH